MAQHEHNLRLFHLVFVLYLFVFSVDFDLKHYDFGRCADVMLCLCIYIINGLVWVCLCSLSHFLFFSCQYIVLPSIVLYCFNAICLRYHYHHDGGVYVLRITFVVNGRWREEKKNTSNFFAASWWLGKVSERWIFSESKDRNEQKVCGECTLRT